MNCNRQPSNKSRVISFFDSIQNKDYISRKQLYSHLKDTGLFTGKTNFMGDTVYFPESNYRLVILSMDYDRVCLFKYLLVYKKGNPKNIDNKLLETDCDIDYGTNYTHLEYKIFSRTLFFTREAFYQIDSTSKVKIDLSEKFYKLNSNGKIEELKSKPKSLVLPKFIPMDVIDKDS